MTQPYRYSDFAIGVTTFNRARFVETCAAALNKAHGIESAKLIVIDDNSSEYDIGFLRKCFPSALQIESNAVNSGGADYACRNMLVKLCRTGAKILIMLDSDLLPAHHFLEQTLELFGQTSGFLSLFNTPSHPAIESRGPFVLKDSVGAAGTVWRTEIVEAILASTPPGSCFDWRFCQRLKEAHIDILAVKASLVQHLGFAEGQNSSASNGDIGIGFTDSGVFNAYAMQQEIAYALNEGFKQINRRLDQQHSVIESNLTALRAVYKTLTEMDARISVLERATEKPRQQPLFPKGRPDALKKTGGH